MTDLGPVERLAAGAVGEPGARTFFLEVGALTSTHRFVLEKEQVAALAREALATLRREGYDTDVAGTPLTPRDGDARRIAEMRVGYRDGVFHFVIIPDEDDTDADEPEPFEFEAAAGVVAAMAGPALEAVSAGRPRCQRCGLPEDPGGHVCPASNGDLRRRR